MNSKVHSTSASSSASNHDDESSSSDDGGGGGVQLHSVLKIKNVLYYKKHTRTAVPAKGQMRLCQKKIYFRGKGVEYNWDLDSICVERFKGRINSGIKIIGRAQTGGDQEEFIFTKVKESSYDVISSAVDEAKFGSEMRRVRRCSINSVTNSGVSLSKSLSAGDERAPTQRPSILLVIYRFIFWIFYRIASFIYRLFTGRRLWGPKNMHDALRGVLAKIGPITTVAKMTLSQRRVAMVSKDIDSIHESLSKIHRIIRRQQSAFLSRGLVVETVARSLTPLQRTKGEISSFLSFLVFSIRKTLNLPVLFRWDALQLVQYPSTVGQAVRNANDRLEALMELAVDDKYTSGAMAQEQILSEAKMVQFLLFNIKMQSTADISSSASSLPQAKEE